MISESMMRQFADDGYLVIPDVFDQHTTMAAIRADYNHLLDRLITDWVAKGLLSPLPADFDFFDKLKACYEAGCDWFQPMDISLPGDQIHKDTPMHFSKAVFDMITDSKLLDIVESLIGPEITSNPIQHVRIKPPAAKLHHDEIRPHISFTDWHQDRGVTHSEADETQMITVWIAVNDATTENGCLQVIPKAKGNDLLPHCSKTQTAIADDFIDTDKAVALPVKSGGIVILDPLTPHSSLVNNTDQFRWSFDIRFNRTGQPTGRSHFPDFIARSKSQPERVLRDWQRWKSMWEDARHTLADQPHTPIHRWTNDTPYCA